VFEAVDKCVSLNLLSLDDHVAVITRSLAGKHIGSISALYNVRKVLDTKSEVKK
jgi:hypothetical protein